MTANGGRLGGRHVVARLRAHKLVPAVPVELVLCHRGVASGRVLRWRAVNPVTGQDLHVASRFTVTEVAYCRHWRFTEEDGVTLIETGAADGS